MSIVGQLLRLGLALPALAKSAGGRRAAERTLRGLEDEAEEYEAEELDDEAWLETVPVVEADPEREAERRRLLLAVEHKGARDAIKHAPLRGIEQYSVVGDPVAYEEWFARQPKPPREQATCLTEEDRAAVEWVTRHNPPWIRGKYLGYYRPPVPAHLFLPGAQGDLDDEVVERPAAPAEPPRRAEGPVPDLQARITRLLDRNAVRLPEEIDLAEAICALKWPKWPDYRGEIDPFLLQRALEGIRLDDATLNWLGSHELTRACRSAAVKQPQGP